MQRPEPDFARFLKVVRRQGEPDRVPFAELFHDWEIMAAIQGPPEGTDADAIAAWRVRFWRDLGYDYLSQGVDIGFPSANLLADDTAALSRGQRGWVNEARGVIATWEDFEAYQWPQVTPSAFRSLEAVARHLPPGMRTAATIPGGPFENLTFLMGFEQFSYALVDQPDLVAAVAQRVDEILCQVVENTASMDSVGAQWLNDDMGFKNGTLASPEVLRQYIFPTQRRICEIAHRYGKPVLLHSCGKLDEITDELIDHVGVDAKHSFEDVIMPVWEVKRRWGAKISLLGGVDVDVLARGSEEQVRAYTRRCIEECAPGGGWALGSGNSVANYVPVANFLAMLDEGWRHGRYLHS
jgi:uroporphyrinogen decarboxylase